MKRDGWHYSEHTESNHYFVDNKPLCQNRFVSSEQAKGKDAMKNACAVCKQKLDRRLNGQYLAEVWR